MCGSRKLIQVWDFGKTPFANAYISPKDIRKKEQLAPLNVYKCLNCHLVQLLHVVDPNVLFGNYLYVSSTSPSFVRHFEEYAETLRTRLHLTQEDLVIDVGSNDGVLLKPLKDAGVRVLGVEPAKNIARQANKEGIPTVSKFFLPTMAKELAKKHGRAKVISANNVFAHTDNVDEFVKAVKEMLAPGGVFVFEVQYLKDLLEKNLFDIVYHEHVCYYHLHPLVRFFEKHDLQVFDVERVPVHGGSIRVYVGASKMRISKRLKALLRQEEKAGLNTLRPYGVFAKRITNNKKQLRALLQRIRKQGKRVVGYGAPAKATTLMYVFKLTKKDIAYIVDDSPLKQGLLMPGRHIPIVSSAKLRQDQPEYALILAWNFAEPIVQHNDWFAKAGGKWIVPVPRPRIV